ncbi:MAG: helix-turn-helix domain-containing protein [Firmicutes bacterium]|nr:helix-turn-helix domain-containing protein [Bacillota bacterium]MBQ4595805.1 helix-turn-helix domain-containing protein [Bacillota bacterium]
MQEMIFEKKQESFAKRLRRVMDEQDIRQVELCMRTGIGKSAMSQYLGGAFLPKQEKIRAIAKVLDVSEGWLMGYDVPRKRLEVVREPDVIEVVADDGAMAGAHIPHGAVVRVRKCESFDGIDNGAIVCFSMDGIDKKIRYYSRNGEVVVLTAAEPGYEPVVVGIDAVGGNGLVVHGVVDRVEIKL